MQQITYWALVAFTDNGCPELINRIRFEYNERFSARMGDANWTLRRVRLSGPLFDVASVEVGQRAAQPPISTRRRPAKEQQDEHIRGFLTK